MNYWSSYYSIFGPIELVRYYAGDVAEDFDFLGPVDAQRIQGYFVSAVVVGFDRTNKWTFWEAGHSISSNPGPGGNPTVTVVALNPGVTSNFHALITGDFNRSYTGAMKGGNASLELVDAGSRLVPAETEFELPVVTTTELTAGAVSMILNFPSDLVEVTGVTMDGAGGLLNWSTSGDELRIGWNTRTRINLDASDQLLMLHLKTTGAFVQGNIIRFTVVPDPLNELADGNFETIPNAVLALDIIESSTFGIDEKPVPKDLLLSSYPNPAREHTTITYSIPEDGRVTLEICSLLGNKVATLVNASLSKGIYMLDFNTQLLTQGVYSLTLKLDGTGTDLVKTIKLVREQ